MRLKKISLFALLSLTIASGCSASRSLSHRSHEEDDRVVTPPRHNYEYSPTPSRSGDDFLDPRPAPAPGEPVPAPPAFGVSRVKSVSWFKDLGTRLHRKPNPCAETCVDEELVGRCTPIEGCAPDEETCEASEPRRPRRYPSWHRARKSICNLFSKPEPAPCVVDYGVIEEQSCAAPLQCGDVPQIPRSKCLAPGAEPHLRTLNEPVRAPVNRSYLHSVPKKDCLAEPLLESEVESLPGLITPADVLHEEPQGPALQEKSPLVEEFLPGTPGEPGSPSLEIPAPATQPPALPIPAAPAAPTSSQIIEPPVWPRLNAQRNVSPVSHSTTLSATSEAAPMTGAPLVVPRARR